jgi:hypothetical protein
VDASGCISVELRRPVENEVQNGKRDRGGKAHVSPENRIAGLKILTSKEVSYMRELAPEARSARGERLRNNWLRRAVPNVGPICGPVGVSLRLTAQQAVDDGPGLLVISGAVSMGRRNTRSKSPCSGL